MRRERDIIRRPGQAPPKKEEEKAKEGEKTKAKAPFKDRVLEKALEYLRGEIRKAGNAPAEQGNRGAEARPLPPRQMPVGLALRATLEFRTRPECVGREELR